MELRRSKNVATYIVAPIVDADGDIVTGAAGLDSELNYWDDGNAPQSTFTDCTNEATEIGSTGVYYLSLTQAEMNHDYVYVIVKTSTAGAKTQHILINCKNQAADVTAVSGDATAADNLELMFDGTGYAGGTTKLDVNAASIANGAITAAAIATDAIDNDAIAANAVTEIQSGLSTLDAAGVRTAVGLASANLDTQIGDLPTNTELGTALAGADDAVLAAIPSAATVASQVRTELTTELARIDAAITTRLAAAGYTAPDNAGIADIPTNSELASALAAADDAVLSAIAALNDFDPAADTVAHVTLVDTTTTNTDMVSAAPTAASVADAVWDESIAAHDAAGSTGEALAGATAPAAADVADAVWDEALAGHADAGSAGAALTGASAPSAADVADAVWDEALVDHAVAGSTGARLAAAAAAGDPWTAELPGDYESGTAGALLPSLQGALTALGAASVTVSNPVADSGIVTLYQGDDYAATHGRSLVFSVADDSHALGLDSATVKLKCAQATWTAASVTSTDDGYTVVFEPTAAETAALTAKQQSYELEATLADGDVVTLATGTIATTRDIPEVS